MITHETIETFDFKFTVGCIAESMNGGKEFKPFLDGSGIGGPFDTLNEARKHLFERVGVDLRRRIDENEYSLKKLRSIQKTLDGDVFNMARFKKD